MRHRNLNHQEPVIPFEIKRDVQIPDTIDHVAFRNFDRIGVSPGNQVTFQQHDQPELGRPLGQVQPDQVLGGSDPDKCEILGATKADKLPIELSLMLEQFHRKSLEREMPSILSLFFWIRVGCKLHR